VQHLTGEKHFQADLMKELYISGIAVTMDDYDQEAKKIWIENCKKFRGQIDSIWLISNSMLINMGAKIISLVTYLDVRTVKSEADIYF